MGGLCDLRKPTTVEAIAEFCTYQRRKNLSPHTIRHRRFRISAFASWLDVELLDASPEHVEKWISALGVSPQTEYTYLAYVSAFYAWAVKRRYVKVDPTEDIERPKLPKRQPRPWDSDDI